MEFRDLKKQYQTLRPQMDKAIQQSLADGQYIGGRQVIELEQELAAYVGVRHCVTCANGTDALTLALKVWGIGPGDAVFVPDFTFFASGECPAVEGATCVFVDVEEATFNLDPVCLENAIQRTISEGKYRPKAVIAVDLFGLPADYDRIRPVCQKYGLLLLEDGAQGFGGSIRGRMACSFGDISTTSFFPAKPLGCYGDGGAIFTDNDEWADLIRSMAVHGKNRQDKYDNIRLGMNSRLDTLQAAILRVKLQAFKEYEIKDVNQVAQWYNELLKGSDLVLPAVREGFISSWAQYTVRLPEGFDRAALQVCLKEQSIPTMVYYPKPMHKQGAFTGTDSANASCSVTEKLCQTVLSLPMGAYLPKMQAEKIAKALSSKRHY